MMGRSLFYLHPKFLDRLDTDEVEVLRTPKPKRIGRLLNHRYFNIWDAEAELIDGLPAERVIPYMKFILAAKHSPPPLKAAIVNTALEHNRLTDAVRDGAFREYDFVSFSGIFIDQYDVTSGSYVNLFQPMGMSIKPQKRTREREFSPEAIHEIFGRMEIAKPAMPLEAIFGYERPDHVLERFAFEPARFTRESMQLGATSPTVKSSSD